MGGKPWSTLSGQISALKQKFGHSRLLQGILRGKGVLFVEAHEANDISRVILLKREVEVAAFGNISLTIVGGAEAWVVASELARANIGVILRPVRCTPGSWDTRKCRVPGTSPSAVELLHSAGVKVSFAVEEDQLTRELIFEVGWAYADSAESGGTLTKSEAIGMATWNSADLTGIGESAGRLSVGGEPRLVVFTGDPLEMASKIALVGDRNMLALSPRQL